MRPRLTDCDPRPRLCSGSAGPAFFSGTSGGGGGGGPTDPNFASVGFLSHFEGANGSTTLVDSSGSPSTVTAFGNAQISTARFKFGSSSGLFDGNGDYWSVPSATKINMQGATAFTLEAWIYLTALTSTQQMIITKDGQASVTFASYRLAIDASGHLVLVLGDSSGAASRTVLTSAGTVSLNTWTHVAGCLSGGTTGTMRVFIGGTLDANTATSVLVIDGGRPMTIGHESGFTSINDFNGNIDEVRVTKGVARYSANFTVPSAAFPDS